MTAALRASIDLLLVDIDTTLASYQAWVERLPISIRHRAARILKGN